jgi:hypothetical protein
MTRELLMVNTRELTKNVDGVEPGEIFALKAEPSRKVRPCLLRISERCAAHFEIVDVIVGGRSQNPASQSIPAARFSARHDGGEWVLEDVSVTRPLVMLLKNTSDKPLHFEGAWECDDGPRPEMTYLVHDVGATWVPPGVSAMITSRPQRNAIAPRDLWIPPEIARHFAIVDVAIGNRSQFSQAHGGVPASKFSHGAGAPFSCDTIQTAMDFTMTVTNTSDESRAFVAVWGCDVAPPPSVLTDRDVERIADAVAQKMRPANGGVLEKMSRDHFDKTMQLGTIEQGKPDIPGAGTRSPVAPFSDAWIAENRPAAPIAFPVAVTPLSTIDSKSGEREPTPTRAERRDPPGFGWDPFGE